LGSSNDNALIARPIYALSFNHQTRVADWVTYAVTAGSIGVATNLSREPLPDPYISDTLSQDDYSNNAEGPSLQQNSFAPMVSFAGTPFWNDVNYLTNMVPRNSDLSRGSWYGLEWAVRNLANRTDALYVVTGPIYDSSRPQQALESNLSHAVPSGFFKVVATSAGQIAAFTFDQELPFHVHHCEQLTTLEEVEQITGLDLFPEATDWPRGDLSSRLGCY
jgi:endonuclease G